LEGQKTEPSGRCFIFISFCLKDKDY